MAPTTLVQPYDALSRLAAYFADHDIAWSLGGSWSLLFWGVALPAPPRDLDILVGLDSPGLDDLYAANPWIVHRPGESEGRSVIPADCYAVDLFPARSRFQLDVLGRPTPIPLGGLMIPLVHPMDTLLFKAAHDWRDARGLATCKAILDWRWAVKPVYRGRPIELDGACRGTTYLGPVRVDPMEGA